MVCLSFVAQSFLPPVCCALCEGVGVFHCSCVVFPCVVDRFRVTVLLFLVLVEVSPLRGEPFFFAGLARCCLIWAAGKIYMHDLTCVFHMHVLLVKPPSARCLHAWKFLADSTVPASCALCGMQILHIDFGDCFEVAMNRGKFPEKIPFRLTRMLVNAMEVRLFHVTMPVHIARAPCGHD